MKNFVSESSGYSLEGSMTHDLTVSKMWLISELEKIRTNFSTAYILGSWYSNTSLYIKLASDLKINKIVNVETNKDFLTAGKQLHQLANVSDGVYFMLKDSNRLDYRQIGKNGLVINTSLTDMKGTDWFKNIPKGTLVALQARDHDPNIQYSSPKDIMRRFPLTVLYSGTKQLEDPESMYNRFMVIGIK